jgi:hypothetical protein
MLAYSKERVLPDTAGIEVKMCLSDRKIAGLQYLGGYVLHNLHRNTNNWKSSESQQAMSLLKACDIFQDRTLFQKIDIISVIQKSVKDVDVISAFNAILCQSELHIFDDSIGKDILHFIIDLYLREHSFSFAKDIIHIK